MRAVDTNVLVRLLVRDDERQARAAQEFVSGGVWVSHLVMAETVWVLQKAYEFTHEAAANAVQLLLGNPAVAVEDEDVVIRALEHYRRRPNLRFTDCLILEIAAKAGHLPLGTFDRNLGRLDGAERL